MAEFRDRLLTAPRWVIGLTSGVLFGAVMGVMSGLRHGRWAEALIEGAIAGVVYGVVMGVVMHRQFGRYREAVGDVPQSVVRKAAREARRGRVPEDPEARRAAYRLLSTQLEQLQRQRRWAIPFFVLFTVGSVFLAVTRTPASWVGVLLGVALLVLHLLLPRRLRPRLELLRD